MSEQVRVGSLISAYAGGYFGRDQWMPVRVEAMGADWVVARTENGNVQFADCAPETLTEFLDNNSDSRNDEI